MTLTRRDLLLGFSALTLLSGSATSKQRPFLFSIEDYVDPQKEPEQFWKFYLDDLNGITLVHVWSEWCLPCIDELPNWNKFYEKRKNKICFVSALDKNLVNYKPYIKDPKKFYSELLWNELIELHPYESNEWKSAWKELKTGKPSSQKLITLVDQANARTQHEYNQPKSRPLDREVYGKTIQELKAKRHWLNFSSYILDDDPTRKFLGFIGAVPHTKLLIDGVPKGNFNGSDRISDIEKYLRKI